MPDHDRPDTEALGQPHSVGYGFPAWWAFPGAEDMRRELQRDDAEVLERRQWLVSPVALEPRSDDFRELVVAAVRRAAAGELPADDHSIVELGLALDDLDVRDYSFGFSLGADAEAAERLWTALMRSCPGRYCAGPAVLAAVSAYLRGDVLRARVAVDIARITHPLYRIADLLNRAFDLGLPPSRLATEIGLSASGAAATGSANDDPNPL